MSETLAPIHFWMYYKIQEMDKLVRLIDSLNRKNQWYKGDLYNEAQLKYGIVPIGDLKELIDLEDIHKWVENCVDIVEGSFAYCVTKVLDIDSKVLDVIKSEVYDLGSKNYDIKGINVTNNYDKLNSIILNGMPCDNALEVISSSFTRVEFKEKVQVHDKYWQIVNGDVKNYHEIMLSFINGIFSNGSSVIKQINSDTYEIVKEKKHE